MTKYPDVIRYASSGTEAAGNAWRYQALACFAANLVENGGLIFEIDSLTPSVSKSSWGNRSRRSVIFPPVEYVQNIARNGLIFENAVANQLAGECVVGGSDFEFVENPTMFDPDFNSPSRQAFKIRTLDARLHGFTQTSLLVFGGVGIRPEIIFSGQEFIKANKPFIAVRSGLSQEFEHFRRALFVIEPSYEWDTLERSSSGSDAIFRPYRIAVPASRHEYFEVLSRSADLEKCNLREGASSHSANEEYSVKELIASRGFYPIESNDAQSWRWSGALPRASLLVEVSAPGLYEIKVEFFGTAPHVIESINEIRINGKVFVDYEREKSQLQFAVTALVERTLLIEIDHPIRRKVDSDSRWLGVSLAKIRALRLAF